MGVGTREREWAGWDGWVMSWGIWVHDTCKVKLQGLHVYINPEGWSLQAEHEVIVFRVWGFDSSKRWRWLKCWICGSWPSLPIFDLPFAFSSIGTRIMKEEKFKRKWRKLTFLGRAVACQLLKRFALPYIVLIWPQKT